MAKRRSGKDGEMTAAVPVRNRLNLTEERDELKRKLMGFVNIEAHFKNLTEERDELKRKLIDFGLHSFKWMNFSGSFYYISSCVASWNESRADCLKKGADLVIIDNHEEQEFTRGFKKYAWIGLTQTNAKWKWVDGTPLTTSYWGKSEPNNATGREDCAEINNYYEENSWNDASCNLQRFWICEKLLPK